MVKGFVKLAPLGSLFITVDYKYDVLGRRVSKQVTRHTSPSLSYRRFYSYDGENMIAEMDAGQRLLASYTYSPGLIDDVLAVHYTANAVSVDEGGNAIANSEDAVSLYEGNFYYLKDNTNSVTDIIGNNGAVVQRYSYGSFGNNVKIRLASNAVTPNAPIKNSFTYTGREYDKELQLYYYRARMMDPSTGRFLQQDPYPGEVNDPISIVNKYAYVGNSPLNMIDPTGLKGIRIPTLGDVLNAGHDLIKNVGREFDKFVKSDTFFYIVLIAAFIFTPQIAFSALISTVLNASRSNDWSIKNLKKNFYEGYATAAALNGWQLMMGGGVPFGSPLEYTLSGLGVPALKGIGFHLYSNDKMFQDALNVFIYPIVAVTVVYGRFLYEEAIVNRPKPEYPTGM